MTAKELVIGVEGHLPALLEASLREALALRGVHLKRGDGDVRARVLNQYPDPAKVVRYGPEDEVYLYYLHQSQSSWESFYQRLGVRTTAVVGLALRGWLVGFVSLGRAEELRHFFTPRPRPPLSKESLLGGVRRYVQEALQHQGQAPFVPLAPLSQVFKELLVAGGTHPPFEATLGGEKVVVVPRGLKREVKYPPVFEEMREGDQHVLLQRQIFRTAYSPEPLIFKGGMEERLRRRVFLRGEVLPEGLGPFPLVETFALPDSPPLALLALGEASRGDPPPSLPWLQSSRAFDLFRRGSFRAGGRRAEILIYLGGTYDVYDYYAGAFFVPPGREVDPLLLALQAGAQLLYRSWQEEEVLVLESQLLGASVVVFARKR